MRQQLFDNFNSLTDKLEGHLPYMYLDTEGLVTIGRGNLIDPVASAADRLVAAALAAGGADNVTVVVVESEVTGGLDSIDDGRAIAQRLEETLPRIGGAA